MFLRVAECKYMVRDVKFQNKDRMYVPAHKYSYIITCLYISPWFYIYRAVYPFKFLRANRAEVDRY